MDLKVLVLSDSHSAERFMQLCVEKIHPDALIHLGDYVRDGESLWYDYPDLPYYQVAGNCDRYRVSLDFPEVLVRDLWGVRVFMTHGHLHGVKQYSDRLIAEGRRCNSRVILYGHTHVPDCRCLEDGAWVLNPGSAGDYGGTAGIITITENHDVFCSIVKQRDLEALE